MAAQNQNLDKIEHIVVLMMENRSFDNVLGFLYPGNPLFNGVNTGMSNPRPGNDGLVHVSAGTDITAPFPDPNEPYDHVYMQMFNPKAMPCPIPLTTQTPGMQGFVIDYANALAVAKPKSNIDPGVIMSCFEPASLPVINGLAAAYAVCDHWYSSVPTQTYPNRSFVHAATSSGNVINTWKTGLHFWDVGAFINDTPTIFNLLETKGVPWKVYSAGHWFMASALLLQEQVWPFASSHFFDFGQFGKDLAAGTLPAYTFIEPNYIASKEFGPETDMHPAYAVFDDGAPPTNVLDGDKFIFDIYTALRGSDYWDKTLFVITFDEHGGCFDHQAPPPAVAPDGKVIPANAKCDGPGSGFDFKRLGVRVPAVLVSPWIEPGTICSTVFDHTSIIRTVANKWLGGKCLTHRDAAANDLSEVLSLPKPRTDKPVITPRPPPKFSAGSGRGLPSGLQRDLVVAAAHFSKRMGGEVLDLLPLKTKEDINAVLHRLGKGLRAM